MRKIEVNIDDDITIRITLLKDRESVTFRVDGELLYLALRDYLDNNGKVVSERVINTITK